MKKNDDDVQKKCEDFVKYLQNEYPGVKECFVALHDFKWRNHRLPACAERNGVISFMGEVHANAEDKKGYHINLLDYGFGRFHYYNERVSVYNPVTIIRISGGDPGFRAKELANSLLRDGLDPDEALAAYKELFDKAYTNLQKVSKNIKVKATK